MSIIPSAAFLKIGIASTFIMGVAVGSHVKKKIDKSFISKTERRNLHRANADFNNNSALKKKCDVLSKVYATLQSSGEFISTNDSVTSFYLYKAKKTCHTYLSSAGFLEICGSISLENWMEESDWIDNTDFWPRLPAIRHQKQPSYSSALLSGVTALWHLSRNTELQKTKGFFDTTLMETLCQNIGENEIPTISVILKMFANLLTVENQQQIFKDTGLVDVLNLYSENSLPELFLPAWRGIHNLKQINKSISIREVYNEGIYPFNPPFLDQGKAPEIDIILVHGIRGGAAYTWRQNDQEKIKPSVTQEHRKKILNRKHLKELETLYTWCWPLDWLVSSLEIPVRILAVDYNANWQTSDSRSAVEARGKSISEHAGDIADALKAARVGDRPIVWIAHSMGGLIVKNIIVNDFNKCDKAFQEEKTINNLAKETLGMVFFSVPHHGSPLASFVSQPLIYHLLHPTREVCEMFEDPGIGQFYEIDASHLEICKPVSRQSQSYVKVATFFQKILKNI